MDFSNTVLIMTSNLGASMLAEVDNVTDPRIQREMTTMVTRRTAVLTPRPLGAR